MHFWQAHHWWWWWSSWRRRCWWSRNERSLESLVLFSLISHIKPTDFINHYSSWTTFLLRCYLKRCFYDMIHIANTYVCVDCIVDWREKRGSMMTVAASLSENLHLFSWKSFLVSSDQPRARSCCIKLFSKCDLHLLQQSCFLFLDI